LSHGLKRELRLRDLVLIQVLLIVSMTWPGYAARQGGTQLVLWMLAIMLFYIPLAAVVMQLSRAIPVEGGAYQWVKRGLSPFAGYMAGWSVTVAVVALYAALGPTLANGIAYVAGPSGVWMNDSKPLALGLTAAICVMAYAINARGLHLVKWLSGAGSILLIATFGVMLYLLGKALLSGVPEARGAFSPAVPAVTFMTVNVFSKMTLGALSAFDQCSIFSEECRRPENDVARSVAIAAPLIAILYIGGTGALLAYTAPGKIDLAAAVPQLLQAGFGSQGAGGLMTAASVAVSMVALLAAVVISVGMLARLPMVAGWDGLLPEWWSELHPVHRTPSKAIAAVTAALMLLGIVSSWGAGNDEAAQVAAAISVGGFSMVYLLLFGSVVFGFQGAGFRPAGWLKAGALGGMVVSMVSLILALAPLGEVSNPAMFALKVGLVLTGLYGCGIALWRTSKGSAL
jgi:amino acid transporter